MATVVYQGLQSYLDSQLGESRMLRLRFSSPKPQFSQSLELATKALVLDSSIKELGEKCYHEEISQRANFLHDQQASSNRDSGGWTCLQALYNPSHGLNEAKEKESTYVHPLVKRSSSKLSEKSLELCTENLGSETGSDISEDSIFLLESPASSMAGNSPTREQQKPCQLLGARKANSHSFPPPLTTLSGSESLRLRSHREDGRLIIKAAKSPSIRSCFHAERSNGRLRLRLVKDSSVSSFDSATSISEIEANTAEANIKKEEAENDTEKNEQALENEGEESEEEAEEGNAELVEEETDDSDLNGGYETGMEEFQIPSSRCKEGELDSNGLLKWEPFWVATS